MILNILTRDAAFFTAVFTGSGVCPAALTQLRCFDRLPETRPAGAFAADITPDGLTGSGIPDFCDAVLTETDSPPEGWEGCAIRKYQPVEKLLDLLSGVCLCSAGLSGKEKNGCRTFCFTSATGGSGVSTVAMAAAKCENSGSGRVFYLDLKPVPGAEPEAVTKGATAGEILFALGDPLLSAEKTVLPMISYAADGTGFIRTGTDLRERAGFDSGKVLKLLEILSSSGKFGFIAVDCDFSFDGLFRAVSDISDCTVLVCSGENDEKTGRLARFFEGRNLLVIQNRTEDSRDGICIPPHAGDSFTGTVAYAASVLSGKGIFGGEHNDSAAV